MVDSRSDCRRSFLRPCPRRRFQRVSAASMLEDFFSPPVARQERARRNPLAALLKAGCTGFPWRKTWGRRSPWARATRVEIASYLPDARPDAAAHFTTASQQPNNPLLDLKVYLPGKDQPLRQIAFAKNPLLNLDWNSRLELPGQFLVSPSGGCAGGRHAIPANAGRQAALPRHRGRQAALARRSEGGQPDSDHRPTPPFHRQVPSARPPEDRLSPVRAQDDDAAAPESAVLVKVEAGGETHEVWLKRARSRTGYRRSSAPPEGPLPSPSITSAAAGVLAETRQVRHELNPGMMGDASFTSSVRVTDKARQRRDARRNRHESTAGLRRLAILPIGLRYGRRRQTGFGSHGRLRSGRLPEVPWLHHDLLGHLRRLLRAALSFLAAPGDGSGGQPARAARPAARLPRACWPCSCCRGRQPPHLPARPARRHSIGVRGKRCRCRRAAARSRWIRWPGDSPHDQQHVELLRPADATKARPDGALSHVAFHLPGLGSPQPSTEVPGVRGVRTSPRQPAGRLGPRAVLLDSGALRAALGLPADRKHISFLDLAGR